MPHTFSRRRTLSMVCFLAVFLTAAEPFDSDLVRVSAEVLAHGERPVHAQAPPPDVAADADVQAAQRLFTAWLEGQMLSRHLPGIAIGVVADQELVWSKGFGLADTANKVAMTPPTKWR